MQICLAKKACFVKKSTIAKTEKSKGFSHNIENYSEIGEGIRWAEFLLKGFSVAY